VRARPDAGARHRRRERPGAGGGDAGTLPARRGEVGVDVEEDRAGNVRRVICGRPLSFSTSDQRTSATRTSASLAWLASHRTDQERVFIVCHARERRITIKARTAMA
jgi:hypothetical protein